MTVVTFDTLKFAQTLRDKAGVPQPQAEGIAEAFAEATGEQIATKGDLRELELTIRADLKQTELSLKGDMKDLKGEQLLIRWMMGFVLAFQVAIFAKMFFH